MKNLFKYIFISIPVFFISCQKDKPIFSDCEFPYETVDSEFVGDLISREELPEEIIHYVFNNFQDVIKIEGAVIDNCLRGEILFVILNILEVETVTLSNGEITELEIEVNNYILYNNCGDLIGQGKNIEESFSIDEFNLVKSLIGEEFVSFKNVTELNYLDNSKEYIMEVKLQSESDTEELLYLVNLDDMIACIIE